MKDRSTHRQRPTSVSVLAGLVLALAAAGVVSGRALETSPMPPRDQDALAKEAARPIRRFDTRLHSAGNIYYCIGNWAQWGIDDGNPINIKDLVRLSLTYNPSGEFPKGTRNKYIYVGGFWFGGIVGSDTLVSNTVDGASVASFDEINSYDTMTEASTVLGSDYYVPPTVKDTLFSQDGSYERPRANADEQFKAVYSDTLVLFATDKFEGRPHKPLGIEVTQYTYAWNSKFARNFIIIELFVKNISEKPISKFTLGAFTDYDIYNLDANATQASDDISGFLTSAPNLFCPEHRDSLNVAWAADNDGDPRGGTFPTDAAHGIAGVRFLNAPSNEGVSFNWWTLTNPWGPAKVGSGDPVGFPSGDRRMFYLIANQTIDYGQVYAAIDYSSDNWRKPTAAQCGVAAGADTRQVISCGPMKDPIMPGQTVRFALAYLNGNNFHTDPNPDQFDCNNPGQFFAKKNFSELAQSAEWASWIYDAPGVADNVTENAYKGEKHLCSPETAIVFDSATGKNIFVISFRDTVYYTGDLGPAPGPAGSPIIPPTVLPGIPNLAGPESPPCPNPRDTMLTFETEPGIVRLMWNGSVSETTPDRLSKKLDFEGFRVYAGRFNSADRYSLLASWDREDYVRHIFDGRDATWRTDGRVVMIERLRSEFNDPNLEPSQYSFADTALCYKHKVLGPAGDSVLQYSYFVPWDNNRANTYRENDQIDSNVIWRDSLHMEVTDNGDTISYGFYHFDLKNMNPSIGEFFSVTAFDQGDPLIDLDVLESPVGECAVNAVPVYSADVVARKNLGVVVYPNPYKISFDTPEGQKTSYFEQGWEGKGPGFVKAEADRRINFINLPDSATISIYTLAGDLVRTINHPDKNLTTYSSKCAWDLVTRNAQAVVSGIYIYRVDSKLGSQVGKIVIIK